MKYIECGDSFKDIRKFDVGLLLQQIDRLNTYNFIDHRHENYSLKDFAVKFDRDRLDSLMDELFANIEPDFVQP